MKPEARWVNERADGCRSLMACWRAEDIEFRVLGNARALWARHVATMRSEAVRPRDCKAV